LPCNGLSLSCYENPLTSLDVTQHTALTSLSCKDNQLTTLDITQNLALTNLSCGNNQLTTLDLSLHTNLTYLWARNNQLTSLNVKNGNNTNVTLFNCNLNPDLTCVEVDDATWSTANWNFIDATASFSENCNYLAIDDFDLENAISIYPNPVKDRFTIQKDDVFTIDNIMIYNTLGKTVYQSSSTNNDVDISDLSNGIYLVKIESNTNSIIKKIIVQK